MKFQKILTIELPEFKLEKKYWDKIDSFANKRVNLSKNSNQIHTELLDTDCILTGFGVKVGKKEMDCAPQLKYIGALATGYGGIDTKYAANKNIIVTNIPGYATEAVAEFVFSLILSRIRDLEKGKTQAKDGNYSEAGFSPTEIKGKKFGVIGMGRIGTRVAELAKSFGAEVIYWSKNKKENAQAKGINYEDVDKLISQADFLSVNLSLCKDTKNFLNGDRIAKIKKGAVVINTAPMELVDIDALEKRLAKNDFTFILDHSDEMTKEDLDRLSKYDNCLIYPPIGYVTKEASVAKQEIFSANLENFLQGTASNRVQFIKTANARKTADIVIIGAGIIGPSTAFYLSQAGVKNIAIIDAHTAGGEATRATAAMVMHQTGVSETTKLAQLSINKYKRFQDELGIDIGFVNNGSIIFTTTPEGKVKINKQANMQNNIGVKTEIVDSKFIEKETKKLIRGKDILSGIRCSGDGYINANLAVHGYLQKAREKGAYILENTSVIKILLENNEVRGVETHKGGIIYTNTVVNCAGAWAKDLANLINLKVPIKANKKNVAVLENNQFKFQFPIVEDLDFGWYYRPINEGILVGFGFGDWVEDNDRIPFPPFDTQKIESLKKYIAVRSPRLSENMNIIYTNAGYRPMIDPQFGDGLPIIGPVEGIKGYFNNCGYGEFGITLAAIGGELISQIILNKATSVDTKPFLLSRFKS